MVTHTQSGHYTAKLFLIKHYAILTNPLTRDHYSSDARL